MHSEHKTFPLHGKAPKGCSWFKQCMNRDHPDNTLPGRCYQCGSGTN